jgi:hypothetical protein
LLPYWLLFSYFAIGAAVVGPGEHRRDVTRLFFVLGAVILALMIGFRFEVGGDWKNYVRLFRFVEFSGGNSIGDPGYYLLSLVAKQLNAGLWLVNLVCGAIFTWGLFRLAQAQPAPWLAVLVAIPYLVIVVAMGFTRQATALGILMAAFASLERGGSSLRFAGYVAAAGLFHRTAVVAIPIAVFASKRSSVLTLIGVAAAAVSLYDVLLAPSVDFLFRYYVEAEYDAQGAFIRVLMSVVPAVLYLARERDFGFDDRERKIWRILSIAALLLFALLFVTSSSAVIDRLALYIAPLQIVILSRVPFVYFGGFMGRFLVVAYALAVQYTWLNYATHARYWIPYKLYPVFG